MKNTKNKLNFHLPNRPKKKKKSLRSGQPPEDIYESPAASLSQGAKIVGFVLRALTLYIGLFGIVAFLCSAAGLTTQAYWQACYISNGFIALVCLIVTAAVAGASLHRLAHVLVPLGASGGVIGLCAILYGNPIAFLWHSILRIYNFALYHLATMGYGTLGNFMVQDGVDYSSAAYMPTDPPRFWGVFLLAALMGTLLGLCMLKKVRLLPLCIVIMAVTVPVFTYNISKGNLGIGCIIAFCLGCIVLRIYDYRYAGARSRKAARKKRRQQRRSVRREKAARRREEKKVLRAQADEILNASLDADLDKRRSRMARNAVFIAWRQAKKEQKRQAKKAARDSKKQARLEKKAIKKAAAAEKKEMSALKKAGNLQALSSLQQKRKAQKEARKAQKEAQRKERRVRRKEKRSHAFSVTAAGGFAGFGAAALALLALWLPMVMSKGAFPIIAPINNKVQIARAYMTAYLTGNDVDLNDLSAYGINELTPRSLSFEPLEFEDKRILRVESTSENNVYLRSWTGSRFDRETDTWTTADYDQVLGYRNAFGVDFTPDEITYNFNKYIYPSSVDIQEANVYKNLSRYGFTVQQVHVQRIRGSSLLLFVPAYMNSEIGLRAWGSLDEAEYKYSNYYDGIYSSRFYRSGTGYSTVSFITTLNRSEVGACRENAAEYYRRAVEFIAETSRENLSKDSLQEKIADFDYTLASDGIEYIGTNLADRYFNEMTTEEQGAFWAAVQLEEQYRTYVKDTYTEKSGSAAVEEIAAQILHKVQADGDVTEHDLIRAVVQYLADNYTYTQTPDGSAFTGEGSTLDAFLTQVKEGYCTHFATAAAAILREYDLPVRFAEGYIASDFTRAAGTSGAPYRADVTDANAHAWIEVYFDGMGWMQYEVTPGEYAQAMYDPSGATIAPTPSDEEEPNPETPDIPETPEEPKPEENHPILPPEEDMPMSEITRFLLVIGGTACAVLLGFIVYLIVRHIQKKAQLMLEKRYRVINFARKKEAYESASPADRHKALRQINDWILDIFRIMGCPPEPGELPMDFAARISRDYANLSTESFLEVMACMQKEEFGHGLTAGEAEICGEYLSDLTASVYAGLDLFQKIRVRYIKRIL